jgi:hypothetical protein
VSDGIARKQITEADFPVRILCKCFREITLYFNGGELDRAECCGFKYEVRATGYELVITPPAPAPPSTGSSCAAPGSTPPHTPG